MILERGIIPSGASSRNAGFACFGSFTELESDTSKLGEAEMLELVEMRYRGLEKIRKKFSASRIDYENLGGYELISPGQYPDLNSLRTKIDSLNNRLKEITGRQKTFQLNDSKIKTFGLGGSHHLIENKLESQLHSGKLLEALVQLVHSEGVTLLTRLQKHYCQTWISSRHADKSCLQNRLKDSESKELFTMMRVFIISATWTIACFWAAQEINSSMKKKLFLSGPQNIFRMNWNDFCGK